MLQASPPKRYQQSLWSSPFLTKEMEREKTLQGYVAFTKEAAEALGNDLTPNNFGPPKRYIPLCYEPEKAIEKLRQSGGIPMVDGKEVYILHLYFKPEKMISDFKEWRLEPLYDGFRYYGSLELGADIDFEWIKTTFLMEPGQTFPA